LNIAIAAEGFTVGAANGLGMSYLSDASAAEIAKKIGR
jgi:hypothetical protein